MFVRCSLFVVVGSLVWFGLDRAGIRLVSLISLSNVCRVKVGGGGISGRYIHTYNTIRRSVVLAICN